MEGHREPDAIAEALTNAMLAPLRAVGELLATEVDGLKTRVEGQAGTIRELEARVRELEAGAPL